MASLKEWCREHNRNIIIDEWTGIDDKGRSVSLNDVTHGSAKRMKWICNKGHVWFTSIVHRTINGSNCPECKNYGTSAPEQFIYLALKEVYKDAESRCKVLKSKDNPRGIEFDIGIPSIPLCIEYSPTGWHKNSQIKDVLKQDICNKNNINFIRIIDDSYNKLTEKYTKNEIIVKLSSNYNTRKLQLINIVEYILSIYCNIEYNIDYDKIMNQAEEKASKIDFTESLLYKYPDLAAELINYNPELIKDTSNKILNWKCTNCGTEFSAQVYDRAIRKQGCIHCGYNWYTGNIHIHAAQKVIYGVTDLETVYPDLAKEWHKTLNKVKPCEVKPSSHIRPFWVCSRCGYGKNGEWQSPLNNRSHKKQGCPKCGYNWYRDNWHRYNN